MYLYLAGSSREITRVKHWAAAIDKLAEALTHPEHVEITGRWWDVIEARGDANPKDAPHHERMQYAATDLKAVQRCDVLWLFYPSTPSVGCYWEAGYADAFSRDIIISGPGQENSIFTTRGISYESDESAFEYITDLIMNDGVYARVC